MTSDIDDAIGYMQEMRLICDTADGTVPRAYDMAIAALHEKQERKNGCEYCNDPDTEYGAISFPRTASGKVDIDKVEAVEAYFCPNCGRELKPKEAANE